MLLHSDSLVIILFLWLRTASYTTFYENGLENDAKIKIDQDFGWHKNHRMNGCNIFPLINWNSLLVFLN